MSSLPQELRELAGQASRMDEALFLAARLFRQAAEQHWNTGGSGTWPAWSPLYASRNDARRLMDRRGGMLASFTQRGGKHIERIDGEFLEVGSSSSRAVFHRDGAGALPVRDPMPPPELFERDWIEGMRAHLFEDAGRFGL